MLCHCVTPANRSRYALQLAEMFRQRHEVFVDSLGWRELRRDDGCDIDVYDTDDTVYLMVLGDAGEVLASARMNPTWARHQMEDEGELRRRFVHRTPPKGPTIWEGSRLLGGLPDRYGREIARATLGVLLTGLQEFCVRRGITQGVSIFETRALSRVQSLGWRTEPLGLPVLYQTDIGQGEAVAAVWQTGVRYMAATREAVGIAGPSLFEAAPVLDDEDPANPNYPLLTVAAALRSDIAQGAAMTSLLSLLQQEGRAPRERTRAPELLN